MSTRKLRKPRNCHAEELIAEALSAAHREVSGGVN